MRNLSPWNQDSKLSWIPLPDARPIGQRDPKRKGRARINETTMRDKSVDTLP